MYIMDLQSLSYQKDLWGAFYILLCTPDTYPRIPPVTNTTMMYPRSSVNVNTSIPMNDNTYTIRVVCLEQRQHHQWFPPDSPKAHRKTWLATTNYPSHLWIMWLAQQ